MSEEKNSTQIIQKSTQVQLYAEGTQIGPGTIKGVLGKGGAAVVYEVWVPRLELIRAIKIMRPDQTERTKERFETEMRITARLHHPNIVEIHTVGEWDNRPYIEMEKIDGLDLEKILKKQGHLPIPVVTAVSIMVARALVYAHQQEYVLYGVPQHGIVHRDLKPSNIMLSNNGSVKLMDFGIAIPNRESNSGNEDVIDGTLLYIAPEQLKGEQVDARADIFSLGVVMYEMVTGAKTFPAKTLKQLVPKRMKNEYTPIRELIPTADKGLVSVIDKCLIFDKVHRIADAYSVLLELEKIHKRLTSKEPEQIVEEFFNTKDLAETVKSWKKPIPIIPIAGIVTACVVLLGAGFFIYRSLQTKSEDLTTFQLTDSTTTTKTDTSPVAETESALSNDSLKDTMQLGTTSENLKKQDAKIQQDKQVASNNAVRPQNTNTVNNEPIEALPSQQNQEPSQPQDILKKLRQLSQNENWGDVGEQIRSFEIEDGEYFLIKARYQKAMGNEREALNTLDKAQRTQTNNLSADELTKEILFTKAQCLTSAFDRNQNQNSAEVAMESWFTVKYQYRASPSHRYYQIADREIRRISEKIKE